MKKEAIRTAANKNNNITKKPNTIQTIEKKSFLYFFTPQNTNIKPQISHDNDN